MVFFYTKIFFFHSTNSATHPMSRPRRLQVAPCKMPRTILVRNELMHLEMPVQMARALSGGNIQGWGWIKLILIVKKKKEINQIPNLLGLEYHGGTSLQPYLYIDMYTHILFYIWKSLSTISYQEIDHIQTIIYHLIVEWKASSIQMKQSAGKGHPYGDMIRIYWVFRHLIRI